MGTLQPGEILQGRYRIDHLLGEGGMSWVYRGHHLLLQQPVAIKVVKPLYSDPREAQEHVEQLRVEAAIMARLDHPNLVRAFDMFSHGDEAVLVLEMVEGRNLVEIVDLAPKLISERRVLAWTAQILDALEYLHSQRPPVIVRDLKPANVMLGKVGRIRLIDFGLAKRMNSAGQGTSNIVRGMGSEGYAPLEQYAHTSTDARSDLYALGATMYFLLTRNPPPAASLRIAEGSSLADPRTVNETVRPQTWAAIQGLLALRADDRPATAAVAREALGLSTEVQFRAHRDDDRQPLTKSPGKRCVSCDLLLSPVMNQGIEIDCCAECGGVWLDRGELAGLIRLGRGDDSLGKPKFMPRTLSPSKRVGSNKATRRKRDDDSDDLDSGDLSDRGKKTSALDRGLYKVWKLLEDLFD